MCGISGVFGRSDARAVAEMLSTLAHRGPDDEHAVSGTDFSLGARRLSIVGVADGRQPIPNEDRTIWAVQNGELYNYPQAYKELRSRGHQLNTHCDTEILPHLYEDYGVDLVEHIDGMFAIAIWDEAKKRGILARDRVGEKPLYYYSTRGMPYFASEIKALLRIPGFERRINFEALDDFLSFKHVPCPLSIFQGIHCLRPAHRLIYIPGTEPLIERYWDVDFSASSEADLPCEEELVERLLGLLRGSIERRLMSDVPVGFFLSGGVDSALSTALAAEISTRPIKTFTLAYAGDSATKGKEDDRRWAHWTARKFKTEHHEEIVEFRDFPETLRSIIQCFDEPFAGTLSTYYLSRLIAQHVKVALSGDGADELFGSYLSHRLAFPLAQLRQFKQYGDTRLISPFENQVDFLDRLFEEEDWRWRAKLLVYQDDEKKTLYAADIVKHLGPYQASKRLRMDFSRLSADDPLNRILEAEFRTIFPDQVLTFIDRLSMAHSLEVRSTYLDTELVTFAASLPGHMKIRNGGTKYLLKKAAMRYFPAEMVNRKKEGFLLPLSNWLLGGLQAYVRQTLSSAQLHRHGIFNADRVQELIDKLYLHGGDYKQVNKLFSLLVFQEWYELYM